MEDLGKDQKTTKAPTDPRNGGLTVQYQGLVREAGAFAPPGPLEQVFAAGDAEGSRRRR